MRNNFFETIKKQAEKDKNIFLMTADIAPRYFEDFAKDYPEQFVNAGIAESNMIGLAAGLSLCGKNVYCYTIIPFLVMRPLEQIRVDLCYHNLNVKLLGAGGGLVYGLEGATHHAIEDIAIMRSLPNMTVVAPGDPLEAKALAEESINYEGPLYVRFGNDAYPEVHQSLKNFKIGRGIIVKQGGDIALVATGSMLYQAKLAQDILEKKGIKSALISMHTIKPLDKNLLQSLARNNKAIFTLEEHNIIGGFGEAVGSFLAEINYKGLFRKIGLPDKYCSYVGRPDYLCSKHLLDAKSIANFIIKNVS